MIHSRQQSQCLSILSLTLLSGLCVACLSKTWKEHHWLEPSFHLSPWMSYARILCKKNNYYKTEIQKRKKQTASPVFYNRYLICTLVVLPTLVQVVPLLCVRRWLAVAACHHKQQVKTNCNLFIISSGYRYPLLNAAVGGVKIS